MTKYSEKEQFKGQNRIHAHWSSPAAVGSSSNRRWQEGRRWATAVMAFVSGRAGPVDVAYFYWSGPAADDGLDCPIIDFFFVLFCGFGFQLVSFLDDTHIYT